MRTSALGLWLLPCLALLASACSCDDSVPAEACKTRDDCPDGKQCVLGLCQYSDGGDITLPGEDAGVGGPNINDPDNPRKDTDCDGLSDAEEFAATWGPGARKTDPGNPDTDGDGLPDGLEAGRTGPVPGTACPALRVDADSSSTTSPVDPDSDGDGLPDGVEDASGNGRVDSGETDPMRPDTDGDGLTDGVEDQDKNGRLGAGETDPLKADTDGDLCPDGYEDKNRNGKVDPGESDPRKAGDCVLGTLDSDGDGIPDEVEVRVTRTDPLKADTDGDGLLDGEEDRNANGALDPGETDPRTADTDCDGLYDAEERGFRTDPRKADTDGDGLLDGLEVGRTTSPGLGCAFTGDADPASRTFPDVADTDGDGIPDGVEDANKNGRVDSGETDPRNPDTDGDGLSDGEEDLNKNGKVDSGETDPRKADSDGDGIPDGVEKTTTKTDPAKPDTDGDGCLDGEEDRNWNGIKDPGETDPKKAGDCKDTDCDGLRDDEEDLNGNGLLDPGETDPRRADTDGDGLSDGLERGVVRNPSPTLCPLFKGDLDPATRTNPLRKDSDCDGLSDSEEDKNGNGRVDQGETDPSRPDTDGDGLPDGLELGRCVNLDPTNCDGVKFVPDADCGATKTDPTKADTDGDGIPDGAEDLNQNGKPDPGELDPTRPDAGGPVTEACANPRAIQQLDRFDPDLALAASPDFTQLTTLSAGGKVVGTMLYDGTHKIAAFAVRVAALANVTTQEADGRAKLSSVEALDSSITQLFTSWDGYDAMAGHYLQQNGGGQDLKTRVNAVVEKLVPGVSGKLSGLANVQGKFRVRAEYLRRSASHAVVIMAFLPDSLAGTGDNLFRVDDLANGTALAQFGDLSRPVCEKFPSVAQPKVDFVWVVDNSGSMNAWQSEVANAADKMATQLSTAPIDWRIATIYSDTDRTQTRVSTPKPFTRSITQFKADAQPGTAGLSPERGFAPVNHMLQSGRWLPAAAIDDANKVRQGAKVVVIWLTDGREQTVSGVCDNPSIGCNSHPDLYNSSTQLPAGYANWSAYFTSLPGGMGKAFVAGIIAPVGVLMPGEETQTGEYRQVITALQGLEADMRDKAATAGFIQQIVTAAIGSATQTKLAKPPISASIKVAASAVSGVGCNKNDMPRGRTHGFDYDGASKSLVFYGDCRPAANQTVAVSYRHWVEQAPPCGGPCPEPKVCDPLTGQCVCPGDCGGCSGGKVCDPVACACVCPPDCGGLGPGQVCDPVACAPRCVQSVTCATGFKFDTLACRCVCDAAKLSCGPGFRADAATCACVCQPDCGGCSAAETCAPKTCSCACGPASCPQHHALDLATCKCVCNVSSLVCPPGKAADAASCTCKCKADCGGCPKGYKCDSVRCACACDTAALGCPSTHQPDAASCSCACKPDCGGCAFGTVCDQSSCSCKPVPT